MSDDDIIYYDSSVSSLYTIELWWHIVTMFFLWPLFVLQILALRFTPKRLLNRTKVQLIGIGLAALIVQTARFHDPSSAFRRMSMTAQKALYSQLGCILMYAVILVTVAKARTLFVQMNKKMPQWFPVSVFGANVVSHIGATAVSIATGYYTENKDDSYFRKITNCNGAQVVIWNVNSISILVIYYFLYANLRSRIKAFQQDLIRTENAKRATAEQMKVQIPSPSSVPTSNGEDEDESAGRAPQTQVALSPTQTHTSVRVHPTSPTAATRATAATPGASSQSENRLKELDSAVRKMNILTVLLTLLLVGTTDAILAPYETKDGSYRMAGAIQALVNQCGIGVVVWYAWSSPRLVLSSANRRQRGIQFWDTLIYGMKETATSVSYAAREVTSKKDVSKQGSGNKHASKQGSGNKPKIEVDVEPGANRATATPGTLTVSVGKTPLSPSVGALSPKSPALDGFERPKGAEVSPLHMPRVAEEVEIAPIPEADAPKEVKPAW